MSEQFYEELPGGPEDIYEDLPDSAYDDDPLTSPPPLPSTPIPSIQKPVHQATTPPPPIRSPTTQLTHKNQTLPVGSHSPLKSNKASTMKPGKAAPPPKPKSGGGGIDLSEVLKKARERTGSQSALMNLETKLHKKDETDEHIAPWANQLRKTHKPPPAKDAGGDEEEQQPPWVKRKSPVEREAGEEVPEFIRKAKQMHGSVEQENGGGSSVSPPPPIPSKPQVPSPGNDSAPNHAPSAPSVGDDSKPPWLRQREKQQYLARTVGTEENPVTGGPGKPPPMAPKPHKPPPALAPKPATESPAPPPKKPRPVPVPRSQNVTSPTHSASSSPPPTPTSVRDKAKAFSEAPLLAPKPAVPSKPNVTHPPQIAPPPPEEKPPPISPRTEKKSPTPPPVPTRDASMSRKAQSEATLSSNPPAAPERKTSQPPPPPLSKPPGPPQIVPTIREEERPPPPTTRPPPPPDVPPPDIPPPGMPPPPLTPPPPSSPPPSSGVPPGIPERKVPAPLPPTINVPPPVLRGPITQAQPTPPTGIISHFRRRPLRSVDFFNPPKLPSRSTKPKRFPAPPPSPEDEQEIYDDTVAVMEKENALPEDDGPEELYEDVVRVPIPPSSSPSLETAPFIPPKAAPPIPSGPPPNKRPPPPPVQVTGETPDMNYEMDPNLVQNGMHQDAPQELYEELHPEDDISSPPPSTATSSSSLFPPSTSQNNISPSQSPTLERKQRLSKEQKRLQKEEERKEKEKKRLEKEREKEKKKKDEIRMKNRAKGLKAYKEFKLPNDVQSLFAVEVLLDHPKTKDHLQVTQGEVCFVLLINHTKLPDDKYFIEKEDGTMGYVRKDVVQRTAYQSPQSLPTEPAAATSLYPEPEDIYERLPQDEEDDDGTVPPPALPPPNTGYSPARFPAPAQPPPPPPPDEPQDMYEYLPEEQGSF